MERTDMTDIDSIIEEENIDTSQRKRLDVDVLHPQEEHIAVVLLLDTSISMSGDKISQLNDGLKTFKDAAMGDGLVRKRAEFAIVKFDSNVEVVQNFSAIENIEITSLQCGGSATYMGHAIIKGIEMVEERKKLYHSKGISYLRPWIFMITDGEPNDMWPNGKEEDIKLWNDVIKKVHEGNSEDEIVGKKFAFFTVGVENARMDILKRIAPPTREPIKLKEGEWNRMFLWLSRSISGASGLKPGKQIVMENPIDPKEGWAVAYT